MEEIRVVTEFNVGDYRTYSIKRLIPEHPTWNEIISEIRHQDPGLGNFYHNDKYRHKCLLLLDDLGLIKYSVDPPIVDS